MGSESFDIKFDTNGILASQKISQCHSVFSIFISIQNDYSEMIEDCKDVIYKIGQLNFNVLTNEDLEKELGQPTIDQIKARAIDLVKISYNAELQVRETLNYLRENGDDLVGGEFPNDEISEYLGEISMKSEGVAETLNSWEEAKRKIVEQGFLDSI